MVQHISVRSSKSESGIETACLLYNLRQTSYTDALNQQIRLHALCASGEIPGALILLEHDPVITMGVRSQPANILASPEKLARLGIELVPIDRGGDVTYHGPGQLVGYPIMRLSTVGGDVHAYLRALEQTVIDTLAKFGLSGYRNPPAGVWVAGKKVCSIGIAVRKRTTYHGFALNVNPDMSGFALINPCGLNASELTSMAELLGSAPDMDLVRTAYMNSFAKVFGLKLYPACKITH
ncbi:MAG: lipoyl(octanoyl) transferase LipB [Armatimonadota bacterium]